jgi:hypothetical protein
VIIYLKLCHNTHHPIDEFLSTEHRMGSALCGFIAELVKGLHLVQQPPIPPPPPPEYPGAEKEDVVFGGERTFRAMTSVTFREAETPSISA